MLHRPILASAAIISQAKEIFLRKKLRRVSRNGKTGGSAKRWLLK